jgi:flavin reductase (DIM6/NTAB) family NADH-FMN oxidoreductase RutF
MDEQLYRDIMAGFPKGVTVVTAILPGGEPTGLTVTACCSVSLRPQLLLVCIDKSANTLAAIQQSQGFTVNFLAAGEAGASARFAAPDIDRFAGLAWRKPQTPNAGPVLSELVTAHVECRVAQSIEAGDHWIFVGEVLTGELRRDAQPLLHWNRRYFDSATAKEPS